MRFRLTHAASGRGDTSNADARIIVPGIRLLWPNGGETVFSGRRDTVRFARTAVTDLLRLELNRGYPDSAWTTVPGVIGGDSTAFWIVQLPAAEHARLRLTSSSHPEYHGPCRRGLRHPRAGDDAAIARRRRNGGARSGL